MAILTFSKFLEVLFLQISKINLKHLDKRPALGRIGLIDILSCMKRSKSMLKIQRSGLASLFVIILISLSVFSESSCCLETIQIPSKLSSQNSLQIGNLEEIETIPKTQANSSELIVAKEECTPPGLQTPLGFGMGLILEDSGLLKENRRASRTQLTGCYMVDQSQSFLPSSVFNLAGLPPVDSQGAQGSCAGWAWAYYCLTHQIAVQQGYWDTTIPEHQFSPAFAYNHVNFGEDSGTIHSDIASLLSQVGCATMASMPYDENECISWPSTNVYREAMQFRVANTDWDYLLTNDDLEILKTYLYEGNTAVISILVRDAFAYDTMVDDVYTTAHVSGTYHGGHAVCVVGYDDTKSTTDGSGAFLLVNSWGQSWGDNGFWWMSYEAIKHPDLSRQYFHYCDVMQQPYTPSLTASLRISHHHRGQVILTGLEIGLRVNGWLEWSCDYFDYLIGDDSGLYQNHPFPSTQMVFDLSDAVQYLSTHYSNEFYVRVADTVWPMSGYIESFNIEYTTWDIGTTNFASQVPIPDDQSLVEISVELEYPHIDINSLPNYVGGEIELSGTVGGSSEHMICDVGFESGSTQGLWWTWDDNPNNGDQIWGIDYYHGSSGGASLWCGGSPSSTVLYTEHFNMAVWLGWPSGWALYSAGSNSHPWGPEGGPFAYRITCSTGGLADVKEWALYGPIDASASTELFMTFWLDYEVSNAGADQFASVLYSTDGSLFYYLERWEPPIGDTCSYVGNQLVKLPSDAACSTLYFAFIFQGDYTGSMTVDDIDLWNVASEYAVDADSYVSRVVDLSSYESATMSFDYWSDVEAGFDWFSPVYHTSEGWQIPYHIESSYGWQSLLLEIPIEADEVGFYFHSDISITHQGVYIDNVKFAGINEISEVSLEINETTYPVTHAIGSWYSTWDTELGEDGLYEIRASALLDLVICQDTASVYVDNTDPVLTSTTEQYQSGNSIVICGYANSLGGSYLATLQFADGDASVYFGGAVAGEMVNDTTIYWYFLNTSSIPDGEYHATLTLADAVGNYDTIIIAITVDTVAPDSSHPIDIQYEFGVTGYSIFWSCSDSNPAFYELYCNSDLIDSDSWSTGLSYSVDGLAAGTYNFTIVFWDSAGHFTKDTVIVTVFDISTTTTSTTASTTTTTDWTSDTPASLDLLIITGVGAVGVILFLIVVLKRRE
ncbi:MAG: hypothetical protein EAX95_16015 [Candidatus Thorarchaeota archaeon]|nr:hypothetical protein [Candidatus Thorarchaeota archaeon]